MKELRLFVTLTFSDDVKFNDDEVQEIVDNIAYGLEYQANNSGIAPKYSDVHTTHIHVEEQFSDSKQIVNLLP